MKYYICGKIVRPDPAQVIGKGGEADIYRLKDGIALKVYKGPDHPDYAGQPEQQQGAANRLREIQTKLRQFPAGLPDRVIQPIDLALDDGGRIAGYTMPLVESAEMLVRYSDRAFCAHGVDGQFLGDLFRDLHVSVQAIHAGGVVIGDFNDLNVLVGPDGRCYMVDADSYQFGGFTCKVYTEKFLDPLHCDDQQKYLVPVHPHTPESDWYAFTIMLMQSLLYVGPYGGVHAPSDPSKRVLQGERPLKRITVFRPDVRYPKPARPLDTLPRGLRQYFQEVFERDRREQFPYALLNELGRPAAVFAVVALPVLPAAVVRGEVTAQKVFRTAGLIVTSAWQSGKLLWLYHEDGAYRREDGHIVTKGALDGRFRFSIRGPETLIARMGASGAPAPVVVKDTLDEARWTVDTCEGQPAVAANGRHLYWVSGGVVQRRTPGAVAPEIIGTALTARTRIWVGDKFGFGFYRAGQISVQFVFGADKGGINDSLEGISWRGQLVDADCFFEGDRCWFLTMSMESGKMVNRCIMLRQNGTTEAFAEAEAGDGSWLGSVHGKCALGRYLLAATDEGIVQVEARGPAIQPTRRFPDTEPFVDEHTSLFPDTGGLFAVSGQEITRLEIA